MGISATQSLNTTACEILLQEIPGEVCLSYLISGCPLGCKGCHSRDSWSASRGTPLSKDRLKADCTKYQGLLSCVLFMGGEWQPECLLDLLHLCKLMGLKTALYTGLSYCPVMLHQSLDYVKTGAWQAELGGLNNPNSNQRLYDLQQQICLNPLLWPTPGKTYPALPAFSL